MKKQFLYIYIVSNNFREQEKRECNKKQIQEKSENYKNIKRETKEE
jgi:hypothetical protein